MEERFLFFIDDSQAKRGGQVIVRQLDGIAGGTRRADRGVARLRQGMTRLGASARALATPLRGVKGLIAGFIGSLGVRQLARFTAEALASKNALQDMANQIGFTSEQLQELASIGKANGIEIGELQLSLINFNRRLGEAAQGSGELKKSLDRYGIAIKDARGQTRPMIDVMNDVADAIANAKDHSEASVTSYNAFGRAGGKLIPIFQGGKEGLDAFREAAREAGEVMNGALVQEAARANSSLTGLKTALNVAFETGLLESFLGEFSNIEEAFRAARPEAQKLGRAVGTVMAGLAQAALFAAEHAELISVALGGVAGFLLGGPWGAAIGAAAALGTNVLLTRDAVDLLEASISRLNLDGATASTKALAEENLKLAESALLAAEAKAQKLLDPRAIRSDVPIFDTMQLADTNADIVELRAAIERAKAELETFKPAADDAADAAGGLAGAAGDLARATETTLESLNREVAQLRLLEQAHRQGKQAIEDVSDAIEIENLLVREGINFKSEEGREIANLIVQRNELRRSIEATNKARIGENSRTGGTTPPIIDIPAPDFTDDLRRDTDALKDGFNTAVDSMSDAFARFVESGKVDFQSLTSSILADMARIAARQAILGIFNAIAGGVGAAAGGGSTFNPGIFVPGGSTGPNGLPDSFASGGLFRGRGTTTSDSNLARLSDREFVVNARSTAAFLPELRAINDNPSLAPEAVFAPPAIQSPAVVPAGAVDTAPVALAVGSIRNSIDRMGAGLMRESRAQTELTRDIRTELRVGRSRAARPKSEGISFGEIGRSEPQQARQQAAFAQRELRRN